MKLWRGLIAVMVLLVTISMEAALGQTAPASFIEAFDGAPSVPTSFSSPRWDVAIHSRDGLLGGEAGHGSDCGAPPFTHHVEADGARVFQCRDHVMTFADGGGYAVTYLTPDHMADFSQGEAVIRFDVSTLRTSDRDWFDLWITPFDSQLVLPLQPDFPDLQGPPRRAIQVLLTAENSLCPATWVDGRDADDAYDTGRCSFDHWESIPGFPGVSATRRDTIEVRVSRTHIKAGMPAYNFWWYDHDLRVPLDWSRGIVQFGHHSYTPDKAGRSGGSIDCPSGGCGPNTWHWDNVAISPAVPFRIIPVVNGFLSEPAPGGSYVRFAAWGNNVEISANGGATWQPAMKPYQDSHGWHIFNYLHPLPAGTQTVLLRGATQSPSTMEFQVTNLSVFSLSTPSTPAPTGTAGPDGATTPTATATPTTIPSPTTTPTMTPTMTPVILPTATPTSTPTASPTSEPAPLPTSTSTPVPTATSTPTPAPPAPMVCEVWGRVNQGPEKWYVIECSLLLPTQ